MSTNLLTLVPIATFKHWLHRPVSNIGMWLWSGVPVLIVAIILVKLRNRTPQINIEVTMDDGYSAYHGLTITNKGDERLFIAEGQIVDSNRAPNYPKGMFRLGWGNGTQSSVKIPQFGSAQILLASFKDVTASHSLWEMSIWKMVDNSNQVLWWARWAVGEKEDLSYFTLKVTVIAEGARKPWMRYFRVTPKTQLGPLTVSLMEEAV